MYQDKIGEYAPLTIDNIIHTAETDIPQRFRSMPWAYSDAEGRTLEHGTAILLSLIHISEPTRPY